MRRPIALLAALLLALGLAGCGDDDDDDDVSAATTATTEAADDVTTTTIESGDDEPAAGGPTVAVVQSSLGPILVDAEGNTLYLFTKDTADASACTDDCVGAWPPLMLDGEPVAGDGIDASLLGTAPRTDGDDQVTYNGHRLYLYAGDSAAGDTTGHSVGGVWFAVTPEGEAVDA